MPDLEISIPATPGAEWLPPSAWPQSYDALFVAGPFNPAVQHWGLPVIRNYNDVKAVLQNRTGVWTREVRIEDLPPAARHITLYASWASDGEVHEVLRHSLRGLSGGSSDEARAFTRLYARELLDHLLAERPPWDLARVIYQVSMEMVIKYTLQAPMLLPYAWQLRGLTREHVAAEGGFFGIRRQREAEAILANVLSYKHKLPETGLARHLVNLHEERIITKEQLLGQLWLLCVSQETQATATASTIGMVLEHGLLEYAQDAVTQREKLEWLIAEGLRCSVVFPTNMVVAARDTEINGHAIAAGVPCLASYGAANNDSTKFTAGFTPQQAPTAPHIAFGVGSHYCQGKPGAVEFMEDVLSTVLPALQPGTRLPDNHLLRESTGISLAIARLPLAL